MVLYYQRQFFIFSKCCGQYDRIRAASSHVIQDLIGARHRCIELALTIRDGPLYALGNVLELLFLLLPRLLYFLIMFSTVMPDCTEFEEQTTPNQ